MSYDNLLIYVNLPGKDLIPEIFWPNTDASCSYYLKEKSRKWGGGVDRGGLHNEDAWANVTLQCFHVDEVYDIE